VVHVRLDDVSDLRFADLLTFLAVHRTGSITGAARSVNATPSQVSKAVARLERQLGVTLLSRGTRGVRLSDGGRRVLPHLQEMVARLRLIRREEETANTELTVAAPSFLNAPFLPYIALAVPNLVVRGLELPPPLIRAYAAENFFDLTLGLGESRLPKPWVVAEVGEVQKGLFASPRIAATLGRGPIDPERLRSIPFISPIFSINGEFVSISDDCPLQERKLGHQAQTIGLGLEIAAKTDQLIFGLRLAARHHVARGELVEILVEGWDVRSPLYVAANDDRVLASVHRATLSAVKKGLAELTGSRHLRAK
jgi:DNA-binding transcriptional LysR family regulator